MGQKPAARKDLKEWKLEDVHACPNFIEIIIAPCPFVCALTLNRFTRGAGPRFLPSTMLEGLECQVFNQIFGEYLAVIEQEQETPKRGRPRYE